MLQVFIINSFSGDERKTEGIRDELEKIMGKMEYLVFNSEYPGHEGILASQVCDLFPKEQIRFYCCGGSGTFRNVLKGIPHKDMGRTEIAELPCGLTNDFLNLYGAERKKFSSIQSLIRGDKVDLDYIRTSLGPAHNTVSVGYDGATVKGMIQLKELPFFQGHNPYLISIIMSIFTSRPVDLEIEADGEIFRGRFYEVAFGNGNLLGGTFHFGSKAVPNDGKIRMILTPKKGLLHKMKALFFAMTNNEEMEENYLVCRDIQKATVRSMDGRPIDINLDGEIETAAEVHMEVCENGLHFVEPSNLDRRKVVWKKETRLHRD